MAQYLQDTLPKVTKSRSKFNLNHNVKTSLNVGDLVPFMFQEVLPGDTFKINSNILTRLSSAYIKAPMDNLILNVHYISVPMRLLWDRWEEFNGANKKNKWAQKELLTIPTLTITEVAVGSIADYLGIPVGTYPNGLEVNALPFRAYALIWNEWFRDQNNQDPVLVPTDSKSYQVNNKPWAPNNIYGMPAKINKLMEYFTGCLPEPQKGDPVLLPLTGDAPLVGKGMITKNIFARISSEIGSRNSNAVWDNQYLKFNLNSSGALDGRLRITPEDDVYARGVDMSDVKADLSKVSAASVNDLRMAFQLQKLLEKDARGGTRYTELINYHFGVQSMDGRLQRPEFLGGETSPIQINQVVQTSNTSGDSPQANIAGYTASMIQSGMAKSFTEHEIIIGFVSIRQKHSYQQGLNKFWKRSVRTDFYNPTFANIGEQPVMTTEIYAKAPKTDVFGFNEAWADYRYKPDTITGQMRSDAKTGFDLWHFADNYSNAPVLGDEFIKETPIFVDRTIAVPSKTAHQFLLDIYVENEAIRVMPTYSVPGLIDHN